MMIQELRASRSHLALGWSQAIWIVFGSSHLGEEDRQKDFALSLFVYMFINLDLVQR